MRSRYRKRVRKRMLGCSQDLTQNHATEWEQASSTAYYKKRLPWLQASPGNVATAAPEISMCLFHSHHGPVDFILCCFCFFNILLSVYFNSETTEVSSDVKNRGYVSYTKCKGRLKCNHRAFSVSSKREALPLTKST